MGLANLIAHVQIVVAVIAALLIGGAAICTATSFCYLGNKFLEYTARQPEIAQMLMMRMFLLAGLVDAFSAVAVATGLLLFFGKNPFVADIFRAAVEHIA